MRSPATPEEIRKNERIAIGEVTGYAVMLERHPPPPHTHTHHYRPLVAEIIPPVVSLQAHFSTAGSIAGCAASELTCMLLSAGISNNIH